MAVWIVWLFIYKLFDHVGVTVNLQYGYDVFDAVSDNESEHSLFEQVLVRVAVYWPQQLSHDDQFVQDPKPELFYFNVLIAWSMNSRL